MGADICFFSLFRSRDRRTSACMAGAVAVGGGAAVGGGGHGRGGRPRRHGRRARARHAARPGSAARWGGRRAPAPTPRGRTGTTGCVRWHGRLWRRAGVCPIARARGGRGGVAGGGHRGVSARTGSRRTPRCLTVPLSRGVRRDGAVLPLRRAQRAGEPSAGCRRRLGMFFETLVTGKTIKAYRRTGRHEVHARTPPTLACNSVRALARGHVCLGGRAPQCRQQGEAVRRVENEAQKTRVLQGAHEFEPASP